MIIGIDFITLDNGTRALIVTQSTTVMGVPVLVVDVITADELPAR